MTFLAGSEQNFVKRNAVRRTYQTSVDVSKQIVVGHCGVGRSKTPNCGIASASVNPAATVLSDRLPPGLRGRVQEGLEELSL
jgi:hypothetical protein